MTASAGGAGSGSGAGAAGGGDFGGGDYFVSSAAAGKSAGAITSETSSDAAVEGLDGVAPRAARQQLAVALVCACNMNRSMAAHKLLVENGFTTVESFGCARQVKLPGGPSKALCFDWGTPYTDIEATLRTGDERSQKWCVSWACELACMARTLPTVVAGTVSAPAGWLSAAFSTWSLAIVESSELQSGGSGAAMRTSLIRWCASRSACLTR